MKTGKSQFLNNIYAFFHIYAEEIKAIFRDRGVTILVLLATTAYPLVYCSFYKNETLIDVSIAVVDESHSALSAELIRDFDATRDVKVAYRSTDMASARELFNTGKVHGILHIPADYSKQLNQGRQTHVSAYIDMSTFLYYRAMLLASNYVIQNTNKEIQINRLSAMGLSSQETAAVISPVKYQSNIIYNKGMGFSSFLMPAILILIIHQTLIFAIGMAAGTAREENRHHEFVSAHTHRGKVIRVITGKSMAYFSLYMALSVYILGIVPRIFNLPHIGNPWVILEMVIPFLLATIFFAMTVSVTVKSREVQMVLFLFFSLVLLFISGISWPSSNIHGFWKVFSYLFPSTFGVQAFVKANSMGATSSEIEFEVIALWIQTAIYLSTAILVYYRQIRKSDHKLPENQ